MGTTGRLADTGARDGSLAAPREPRLRLIVLLAVLVRLLHLQAVAPTPILSYHKTFAESDMYMFDRWSQQIRQDVLGRERFHFLYGWQLEIAPAEQWARWYGTDPVYYKAPFYPYLIALLAGLFGDAALPLALLQILAAAASVALLFRTTDRLLGRRAGLTAATLLAVYGPAVHFDVLMLRGPWIVLTTLLATWRLVELRACPVAGNAWRLGLAAGALPIVNEGSAPALVLLALLAGLAPRTPRERLACLARLAAGIALVLSPVIARNAAVGSPLLTLAVTGSTVYGVFNAHGSSPYFFEVHPATLLPIIETSGGSVLGAAVASLRSFPDAGEATLFYVRKSLGLLIPWENPDNVNFYYVALSSPLLSALPGYRLLLPLAVPGLVLAAGRWRRLLALLPASASLLLAILITLPLSRYRATLAVYLMPFAGFALVRVVDWVRARRWRPAASLGIASVAIAATAAAVQSRVVFDGAPSALFEYRPAEFLLGVSFYERQGRLADASREALELARRHPDPRVQDGALAEVARLKARLRDLETPPGLR